MLINESSWLVDRACLMMSHCECIVTANEDSLNNNYMEGSGSATIK